MSAVTKGKDSVLEVTSSGLTHTCTDGGIPKFICNLNWVMFGSHRLSGTEVFIGHNYGVIDADFNKNTFTVQVKDVKGEAQLSVTRSFGSKVIGDDIDNIPGTVPLSPIVRGLIIFSLIVSALSAVAIFIMIIQRLRKKKSNALKTKRS